MIQHKCEKCGCLYWYAVILGQKPICPKCGKEWDEKTKENRNET